MSLKNKHEVASARCRLDATLQHLVEKKDDGYAASDGESSVTQPDFISSASPTQSPRKLVKSRKRKRKDDQVNFQPPQHTFVMKLFDRSVDLARFDEDSPLYPICRAWIHNKPGSSLLTRDPTPEPKPEQQNEEGGQAGEGDQFPDIYQLPPPVKDEFSVTGSCRIPAPLLQPPDHLDIHQDPEQAPPAEQLLLDHMARWKHTRNLWKDAGFKNEMRYFQSMNILRDIYFQSNNN